MEEQYKQYKYLNYNKYWKQKGYPKKFYNMLNEYFSRKAYDLDMSLEEIGREVGLFLNNVDEIEFGNFEELYTGEEAYRASLGGFFSKDEKKISLNSMFYNSNSDRNFFDSFAHEVSHAVAYDPENNIRGMYKSATEKDFEGYFLEEIVTEMKASRLASNDRYSSDGMSLNLKEGYNKTAFIATALASALGVSEKEFLQIANKGRQYFDETFSARFPSGNYYNSVMKNFLYNASVYNSCLYGQQLKMSKQDRAINTANSYYKIRDALNLIQDLRLQKEIASNPNMSQEQIFALTNKYKNDYGKVVINLEYGAKGVNFTPKEGTTPGVCWRLMFLDNIGMYRDYIKDSDKLMDLAGKPYEASELMFALEKQNPNISFDFNDHFDRDISIRANQMKHSIEEGNLVWKDPKLNKDVEKIYNSKLSTKEKIMKKVDSVKEIFKNFKTRIAAKNINKTLPEARYAGIGTVNPSEFDNFKQELSKKCYSNAQISNNYYNDQEIEIPKDLDKTMRGEEIEVPKDLDKTMRE